MNLLNHKVNHPTKGPLELGRWSKNDLAQLIAKLTQDNIKMNNYIYMYKLLYGFHIG